MGGLKWNPPKMMPLFMNSSIGHGMLIWYLRRGRHHCWGHGVLERTLPGRGTAHLDQCGEEKCLFLFKIPLLPNFEIRDSNSTHIFWGQGGLERTLQAWPRHIWINVGTIYILATKYLWGHAMLNSKSNLKCHPNRKDYGNTLYTTTHCRAHDLGWAGMVRDLEFHSLHNALFHRLGNQLGSSIPNTQHCYSCTH